jgi:dTDP-4-amino-4,6-dideoxygalactose transaminase
MTETQIPFVDLQAQYAQVGDEIEASVLDILRSGDYIAGRQTLEFEAEFAKFCRVRHAIGVGNGTDALVIALRAVGAEFGREVLTVSNTFVATAEAIALTGATPRFIDCEDETGLMDSTLLEAAINEKTCAIIAVHLYGRPCDMDAINAIAQRHNLPVIEDAAQAQGARYKNRIVGSLGSIACFSFYPSKNLGAAGDAGAVVTDDDELADRMRIFAAHGCRTKYVHEVVGTNSRLDSIQGAVLRAKLRHLDEWNARRRALASEYHRLLNDEPSVRLPARDSEEYQGIHHLFAIRVEDRDRLQKALGEQGVAAAVHYPIGVHRQEAFKTTAKYGSLPHTEDWADHELSLPMFETMTLEQVRTVCEAVRASLHAHV